MPSNRIADLTKILPPPATPTDFNEKLLKWNQMTLGIKFPKDVIEFGRIYGSGNIRPNSWEVCNPCRATYPMFVLSFATICHQYKAATEPEGVPFGIFPEVGGVLPFAMTSAGSWVGWITVGEANSWKVVDMHNYEVGDFEILDMSFSEYFLNVLTRKTILSRQRNLDPWTPADVKFDTDFYFDQSFRNATA